MKKTDIAVVPFRPVLVGRVEKAEYTEQEIPDYQGNPLIESLPNILSIEESFMAMAHYPKYSEEQRNMRPELRVHLVYSLKNYVEPLRQNIETEGNLSMLIRQGYAARNPLNPAFFKQFHVGFKEILENGIDDEGKNCAGISSTAAAVACIGASGTGKSKAWETALLTHPQLIVHEKYKGRQFIQKQIVWLKIDGAHDGSLKGLAYNYFKAIDGLVGTSYFDDCRKKGTDNSTNALMVMMAHVATTHCVGVVIIDELQTLNVLKNNAPETALNFFTTLVNVIGIPVVLIGTYRATQLFGKTFCQGRRVTGMSGVTFDPITTQEWGHFLTALWQYQWTQKPNQLTEEIASKMYELTQGVHDLVVKLYQIVQWKIITDAVWTNSPEQPITLELLEETANEAFKLIQDMLDALKRKDLNALKQFDDLTPNWPDIEKFHTAAQGRSESLGQLRQNLLQMNNGAMTNEVKLIELEMFALGVGVPETQSKMIARKVLESSPTETSLAELRRKVFKFVEDAPVIEQGAK